jgi:hypothetical protein
MSHSWFPTDRKFHPYRTVFWFDGMGGVGVGVHLLGGVVLGRKHEQTLGFLLQDPLPSARFDFACSHVSGISAEHYKTRVPSKRGSSHVAA